MPKYKDDLIKYYTLYKNGGVYRVYRVYGVYNDSTIKELSVIPNKYDLIICKNINNNLMENVMYSKKILL